MRKPYYFRNLFNIIKNYKFRSIFFSFSFKTIFLTLFIVMAGFIMIIYKMYTVSR